MPSPSLILVTGASRGIGREIVLQSIEKVTENSVWILTARKIESLIAVREEIQKITPNANVHVLPCELSQWNEQSRHDFAELFKKVLTENQDGFDKFYLFHNAGSIGDVKKKSSELSNLSDWSLYLHSNFLSMVAMNNLALEIFDKTHFTSRFIINITSILAIKAFPSTTQYCCGKAIREAFFRSLATECDDLRILSYSPGPVETDMHDQVANESYDEGMRKMFSKDNEIEASEVHRRKLTTKESVGKMFEILSKNTFISGSRIDFFE